MLRYILNNKKGQSLVEAAFTISIILVVLFALVSVSLYIYDMMVFVSASNKALDKAVGVLSGDRPEYSDGIDDNELSYDEKSEIRQTALNSLNIKVLVDEMDEGDVLVSTEEVSSDNEILLTVDIEGSYNNSLPLVGSIFPQLKYSCTYTYER